MTRFASVSVVVALLGAASIFGSSLPAQEDPGVGAQPGPEQELQQRIEAAEALIWEGEDGPTRALLEFNAILGDHPDHVAARLGRAEANGQLGELSAALIDLDAVLTENPGNAEALLLRAWFQETAEEYESAIGDLERLIEVDGGNATAWLTRARCRYWLERYDEAESDLREAIRLRPDESEAWQWRASNELERGDVNLAIEYFERAEELADEVDLSPFALATFGYSLIQVDEYPRAREVLERSVAGDPTSHWATALLADCLHTDGEYGDALILIDRAIRADPQVGWYHMTRGFILRDSGRSMDAALAFELAMRLDPSLDLAYEIDLALEDAALEGLTESLPALFVVLLVVLGFGALLGLASRRATREALTTSPEGTTVGRYDGNWSELFGLYLKNIVLTLLTLGVYRFWARVEIRKFRYQHTSFADGRFDYHATGRQKFMGFLRGMAVMIPVLVGIYLVWWVALDADSSFEAETMATTMSLWSFFLVLFLLRPWILVSSQRFNLSRTSWSNLRFRFTGKVGDLYGVYLRNLLVIVFTFGLYLFWHRCEVRRFRLQHTRMGEDGFDFRGDGGELFRLTITGNILCALSLGLFVPWQIARLHRFHTENTRFRGSAFRSTLSGELLIGQMAIPAFLSVLSFGLALPWAAHRWFELVANTTVYPEVFDPAELISLAGEQASPLMEGVGEAGEALSDIGEMFGG